MRWGLALVLGVAGSAAAAKDLVVPSGQTVEFLELITDAPGTAETTWRFRFMAPAIARDGGSVGPEAALADIEALCDGFVLPRLVAESAPPEQVVISLSDRTVAFGQANPAATQYFEAYRIEGENCIWEGF